MDYHYVDENGVIHLNYWYVEDHDESESSSFDLEGLEMYHDDSLMDVDDEMWDETNDDSGYES